MKHSITFETEDGFIDIPVKDIRNTTLEGTKIFVSTHQNTKHHVLGRFKDIVGEIRDAHTYEPEEFYVCIESLRETSWHGELGKEYTRRAIIPKANLQKVVDDSNGAMVYLREGAVMFTKESPEAFLKSLRTL